MIRAAWGVRVVIGPYLSLVAVQGGVSDHYHVTQDPCVCVP